MYRIKEDVIIDEVYTRAIKIIRMILFKHADSVSFFENDLLQIFTTYKFEELKDKCFDRIFKERGIMFDLVKSLYIYDQIKDQYLEFLKNEVQQKYVTDYGKSNHQLSYNSEVSICLYNSKIYDIKNRQYPLQDSSEIQENSVDKELNQKNIVTLTINNEMNDIDSPEKEKEEFIDEMKDDQQIKDYIDKEDLKSENVSIIYNLNDSVLYKIIKEKDEKLIEEKINESYFIVRDLILLIVESSFSDSIHIEQNQIDQNQNEQTNIEQIHIEQQIVINTYGQNDKNYIDQNQTSQNQNENNQYDQYEQTYIEHNQNEHNQTSQNQISQNHNKNNQTSQNQISLNHNKQNQISQNHNDQNHNKQNHNEQNHNKQNHNKQNHNKQNHNEQNHNEQNQKKQNKISQNQNEQNQNEQNQNEQNQNEQNQNEQNLSSQNQNVKSQNDNVYKSYSQNMKCKNETSQTVKSQNELSKTKNSQNERNLKNNNDMNDNNFDHSKPINPNNVNNFIESSSTYNYLKNISQLNNISKTNNEDRMAENDDNNSIKSINSSKISDYVKDPGDMTDVQKLIQCNSQNDKSQIINESQSLIANYNDLNITKIDSNSNNYFEMSDDSNIKLHVIFIKEIVENLINFSINYKETSDNIQEYKDEIFGYNTVLENIDSQSNAKNFVYEIIQYDIVNKINYNNKGNEFKSFINNLYTNTSQFESDHSKDSNNENNKDTNDMQDEENIKYNLDLNLSLDLSQPKQDNIINFNLKLDNKKEYEFINYNNSNINNNYSKTEIKFKNDKESTLQSEIKINNNYVPNSNSQNYNADYFDLTESNENVQNDNNQFVNYNQITPKEEQPQQQPLYQQDSFKNYSANIFNKINSYQDYNSVNSNYNNPQSNDPEYIVQSNEQPSQYPNSNSQYSQSNNSNIHSPHVETIVLDDDMVDVESVTILEDHNVNIKDEITLPTLPKDNNIKVHEIVDDEDIIQKVNNIGSIINKKTKGITNTYSNKTQNKNMENDDKKKKFDDSMDDVPKIDKNKQNVFPNDQNMTSKSNENNDKNNSQNKDSNNSQEKTNSQEKIILPHEFENDTTLNNQMADSQNNKMDSLQYDMKKDSNLNQRTNKVPDVNQKNNGLYGNNNSKPSSQDNKLSQKNSQDKLSQKNNQVANNESKLYNIYKPIELSITQISESIINGEIELINNQEIDLDDIPYELEEHVPLGMTKVILKPSMRERISKYLLRMQLLKCDIYHLSNQIYIHTYYDFDKKYKIVYKFEIKKISKWSTNEVTCEIVVQPAVFEFEFLQKKDLYNQRVVSIHYLLPKLKEVYLYSQINQGELRDICHEYMVYNYGWLRNHYSVINKMHSVVVEYNGSGMYKMPNCLILKDIPTYNTEKSRQYIVPILKMLNSILFNKGMVDFEIDKSKIDKNIVFDQKTFEHIYYNRIPELNYKTLIADINTSPELSKYSEYFPKNFFIASNLRLKKYEEVIGQSAYAEVKSEEKEEELKRKRAETKYVDLIDEDDLQESEEGSEESEEENEITDINKLSSARVVRSKHEKTCTLQIDELFTKTKSRNRYSSLKINTIRDENHTRDEQLKNLNNKWDNDYSDANMDPKVRKVSFSGKGDTVRYFDINEMTTFIDFENKSEMFKYFIYN